MKVFTCIVCGATGFDRSVQGAKLFCSRKCAEKHRTVLRAESLIPCKFNEFVLCDRQKCSTCGWNPEVEKRRKEKHLNG